mgnify:CR=1 FL=1
MLNILKYSSTQGSFDATRNLVDIELPNDSGVYDLSQSFFNFNISVDAVHTADADVVYPSGVQFTESARNGGANAQVVPPTNAVMVKHAQLISQRKGKIESLRNVDCLRANLSLIHI